MASTGDVDVAESPASSNTPVAETEHRPFDTSIQGLAALYSRHFLTWLKGPGATWQQELNSVIVAQQRRADFLIRYTDPEGHERLLQVEFQTLTQRGEPREDLPARMATYALFVLNRYGQVPDQVLILLKETAATRRVPNVFAQGRVRVEYDVLKLWELDPAPLLESGLVGLMPLVPLMGRQDLEVLLERCTEVIQAGVQLAQERNEILAVTGLLASLKDVRVVEQFFRTRSIMSLLSETPLFQTLTQERVLEAVRQSKIQSLLALLEHKFGTLGDDLSEALLTVAEADALDRLLLVAADAQDLDGFRTHL